MHNPQSDGLKSDILIVDDVLPNLRVLASMLTEHGYKVRDAPNGPTALMMANAEPPDLILLDVRMPGMDGYQVCRQLKASEKTRDVPIIFISALDELADKVQGFAVGGVDYITKPIQVEEVLARVETHLALHDLQTRLEAQNVLLQREVAERKRVEAALHEANEELEQRVAERTAELAQANANLRAEIAERQRVEEERERLLTQVQEQIKRVQQIIDTVPEGVFLLDTDNQVVLANPMAEKNLITLANAKVGDTLVHLGSRPLVELLTTPPQGLWHEVTTDNEGHGRSKIFQAIARPFSKATETGPEPGGWVFVTRDVTQQREVEHRIQQQERLAAVGQLAAGIAHDFNNIMATIVLYSQMSARSEDVPIHIQQRMATITQQARHATGLIRQILDFSRRSVLERRPFDLLSLLKEQVKLLERTLPENIVIKLDYGAGDYTIRADPTRMQQVLMNLAVNARDAMPEGGTLRIELERIEIGPDETPPLLVMMTDETMVGGWIQIRVSDTGTGISPDVLPRIFDPFFTTKAPGEGTGLGLAQVHGIVGAHEGHIDVKTQMGEGTTFTVYLPAVLAHPPESRTAALLEEAAALPKGQGETILVAEDNAVVREALVESLELLNYQVLEAVDGREALEILEQREEKVALVLSDVVMPGMGGVALLHALRDQGINMGIILLTGHTLKERDFEDLYAQGMRAWLLKPPSLEQLAEVVAQALQED